MRIIGIILIVLGLIGFVIGGITITETEEIVDLGPLTVEEEQEQTFPITPLASGAAVIAGIALVSIDVLREKEA